MGTLLSGPLATVMEEENEEEEEEDEEGRSSMGEEENGKLLRKQDYVSWHGVMGEFDHLPVRKTSWPKFWLKKKKKRI